MRANDRVIVLERHDNSRSASGMLDKRLLTGENSLHGIYDETQGLWYLKFDHGTVPGSLDQKFTSFERALKHVTEYYAKRNVSVSKVID